MHHLCRLIQRLSQPITQWLGSSPPHIDTISLPRPKSSLLWFTQRLCMHIKKQANEIRPGNIIATEGGKLMQVVKYQHSQGAGRQLGSVQLELRDLQNNSKHPLRLRPGDTVDVVRLEERKFDYLYAEGELLHCMNPTNFEQVAIHRSILGPQARFVAEGAQITLEYHDGAPIAASLPPQITLEVAQAAPSIKGEAVHAQFKRAVLSTGVELQVPPFVTAGDTVVVDTESGKFVRRGS